jgi:hypothetical protein
MVNVSHVTTALWAAATAFAQSSDRLPVTAIRRSAFSGWPSRDAGSWLTYTTKGGVTVSAGYSATMGGRESVGGLPNDFRTEEQQARFEVQKFVAKDWQLAAELALDVHVVDGFRQEIGINGRILFVF